jgi:hypothetical protein
MNYNLIFDGMGDHTSLGFRAAVPKKSEPPTMNAGGSSC